MIVTCLMILAANRASAKEAAPVFAPDFTQLCPAHVRPAPQQWQVSKALPSNLRASRLTCFAGPSGESALRVSVHPGDAADPNPGGNPTERVEIQLRRQVVRFDEPVWYRFGFRLIGPWKGIDNRTVIHQVKQDIAPDLEAPRGPCPSANPLFKIEARAAATGAAFLVKVRGAADCRDAGGPRTICGPWPVAVGRWHEVHVVLRPSQRDGAGEVRVWLDGSGCPGYSGPLGYRDQGMRDGAGRPTVNAQPRFGIYRDALPGIVQSIAFAGIVFWSSDPSGDPAWAAIPLRPRRSVTP